MMDKDRCIALFFIQFNPLVSRADGLHSAHWEEEKDLAA